MTTVFSADTSPGESAVDVRAQPEGNKEAMGRKDKPHMLPAAGTLDSHVKDRIRAFTGIEFFQRR